jgi:site-specific recombinase XerD
MMEKSEQFCRYVKRFLDVYLPRQRNLSPNTVRSYRTVLNLFVDYLIDVRHLTFSEIGFGCIDRTMIAGFLSWLEDNRLCSAITRNQRLATLSSFLSFVAADDVSLAVPSMEVSKVPCAKTPMKPLQYLSQEAVKTLLEQPDRLKPKGIRDSLILVMLYDTAARITELLTLKIADVKLDLKHPYVILTGKGEKRRSVPLMERTVVHIKLYNAMYHAGSETHSGDYLFYTKIKGVCNPMSYENASKMIAGYGRQAAATCSEVPVKIHAHLLRATRAMHLYQDGVPLSYIKDLLGHSNINTTSIYAMADLGMLRTALGNIEDPLKEFAAPIDWKSEKEKLKALAGLA